jgi:serine/threonine-protein kinase HipA
MDLFELFGRLPRQGPGSRASTLRALELLTELPTTPRIADLGSGTGASSLVLAEATGGSVLAIDMHPPYLEELERRAAESGLADRIETQVGDIAKPELESASFDAVWSEGAAYAIGFDHALAAWAPLLRPGGYLAVTECSWLTGHRSPGCTDFWREAYPTMRDAAGNRGAIEAAGLDVMGHFPLPPETWWDELYGPLERLLDSHEEIEKAPAELIEESRAEIELFRRYHEEYGYIFYVARRP